MSDARVINLVCPRCGNDLDGLSMDRVFACRRCRIGVDPIARETYDVDAIEVGEAVGEVLYLPFWSFEATLAYSGASPELARVVEATAARVRVVYVTAFAFVREENFASPGLARTRRQDPVVVRQPPPAELALIGIRRSAATARQFVLPTLLRIIDEVSDITGLEARVALGRTRLLAYPFGDEGHRVVDLLTGAAYPTAVLDDIDGVRAVTRR